MKRSLACLILMILLGLPAAGNVVQKNHVEAELVAASNAVQPGSEFWVALRLKMDPRWHTYWKNPGDSGLATSLEWQLPAGFEAGPIEWPYPERIDTQGLVGYAYSDQVFLLTRMRAPKELKPGQPMKLRARAAWLACEESCIPGDADLELTLAVSQDPGAPSAWAQSIAATLDKLPRTDQPVMAQAGWDGRSIAVAFPLSQPADKAEFFPSEDGLIDDAAPASFRALDSGVELRLAAPEGEAAKPTRLAGLLVVEDDRGQTLSYWVDTAIGLNPPAGTPTSGPSTEVPASFAVSLGLAFLGGMLLNLMPCVFPVLSIKVLGFVEQANHDKSQPWKHGVVFAAGVLVSFWVISGALLALRAGGEKLGWGFQLQSPQFVVAVACLFLLIALNLLGVFEVGEELQSLGDLADHKTGFAGSFWTGVLATVVATPCTAPFMGAAVGATLTLPAVYSVLIFSSLGLGMAFPYVLLTSVPALLNRVPRPGAWMITFKQLMAFPMLLTSVWLAWVLGKQLGVDAVATLLGFMVLIALGAWVLGRWGLDGERSRKRELARLVASVLMLGSIGLAMVRVEPDAESIEWQVFSPELVERLREEGKPVFVDFTAAWCLSCQVNEKVALASHPVRERFRALGVEAVKADWTNRDEAITRALESFGRNGVPLYVYYPAGGADPIVLPEVITPQIVLKALEGGSEQKG
ncbi:MAG: thioredoxin family protein [Armatimonadetes bacterium]|nr:thioredoxin family protein [Armatimonadota bacterium]